MEDQQSGTAAGEDLQELVASLTAERDQLAQALETRVVIEQAKGVLAERYRLSVEDAFLLLRQSTRAARMRIHVLAEEVVRSPTTPHAVLRGLARDSRWRAVAMRERTEALSERTAELQAQHVGQVERLSNWPRRTTARIRAVRRSEAVDLCGRLRGYRWHLLTAGDDRWDVVVEVDPGARKLSDDLRRCVLEWMEARRLATVRVVVGGAELELIGPAGSQASS